MRIANIGSAERLRVRKLLAEMRRHMRTHGTLPRIDSNDFALQRAWIELARHLAHNAKTHRQTIRRELRGAA